MKRRTSIRGIVMLVFAAVVVGLAVVTMRYQPAPPADAPLAPQPSSGISVVPILPPAPEPAPPPVSGPVAAPLAPAGPSSTKKP